MQVDAARVGGITPWIKVAHMAEAFNIAVVPHYLMELHVMADTRWWAINIQKKLDSEALNAE